MDIGVASDTAISLIPARGKTGVVIQRQRWVPISAFLIKVTFREREREGKGPNEGASEMDARTASTGSRRDGGCLRPRKGGVFDAEVLRDFGWDTGYFLYGVVVAGVVCPTEALPVVDALGWVDALRSGRFLAIEIFRLPYVGFILYIVWLLEEIKTCTISIVYDVGRHPVILDIEQAIVSCCCPYLSGDSLTVS